MKSALAYARLGWSVLPLHDVTSGTCSCGKTDCRSAGKHPRIPEWQKLATADESTVAEWIEQYPLANVGVATGSASGFFVLDVDDPEALDELEAEHGELPHTVQATTGSGGTHYLFRLPAFSVPNTAGKIAPGIDTRGDGGQIVVAPSVSFKGSYAWVNGPWNTEIAHAPAWILGAIRPARAETHAPALVNRFPAASQAVLGAALAALMAHGPAIELRGGDAHTFVAAALLRHDFALTYEEAWPLFWEWNETCQPPWGIDELAAKLRGGDKYGTGEYGKRRSADAVEVAKKLMAEWREAGSQETTLFDMIAEIRKLVIASADPAKRGVIERELIGVTGLNARALELPKVHVPREGPRRDTTRPVIEVSPHLSVMADAATVALQSHVFARGGALCEVIKPDQKASIHELDSPRIQDLMSSTATWVRHDDKGTVEQAAPLPIASILHSRRTHKNIRILDAVTTAPVFLADGSVLMTKGYNAEARLYLDPSVTVDVPDEPSRDDAKAAGRVLLDIVRDFDFAEKADRSAWLAALLSPLVKSATGNAPAPLVMISAATPGAGKSLLAEVIAHVVTGSSAEIRPYNPRDPAEWGKRLTSFVKAASPVSVFDNVNGPIGDESLDRLITSSTWSDRILGASDAPPLPNVTTWIVTGNNAEPVQDTVRRTLPIRLDVKVENPQERTGFKYPELLQHVLNNRAQLLTAALTILRAWHVGGRPKTALHSWGSFERWSDIVRQSIVWIGAPDPYLTQLRAQAEADEAEHDIHDFWIDVVAHSVDGAAASIAVQANSRGAQEVLSMREPVTPHALKKLMRRFVDKVRGHRRIRRDKQSTTPRWYVESLP